MLGDLAFMLQDYELAQAAYKSCEERINQVKGKELKDKVLSHILLVVLNLQSLPPLMSCSCHLDIHMYMSCPCHSLSGPDETLGGRPGDASVVCSHDRSPERGTAGPGQGSRAVQEGGTPRKNHNGKPDSVELIVILTSCACASHSHHTQERALRAAILACWIARDKGEYPVSLCSALSPWSLVSLVSLISLWTIYIYIYLVAS